MERHPLFSVIIATRNRPDDVCRALHAVRTQTCADFQVLVLDDGSSSENLERLRARWSEFDDRFKLTVLSISDGPGIGPSKARNHGIALATGEYVAFCDDDDLWTDPRHLEVAAAALRAQPDADLYFANQIAVQGDKVSNPNWFKNLCSISAGRKPMSDNIYAITADDVNQSDEYGHMNTLVMRRSRAHALKFWEALVYWEDADFFLRALDASPKALFRSDIVATHYVPNPKGQSASARVQVEEKLLLTALACRHVRLSANVPGVLQFAQRQEGYNLRHLASALAKRGSPEAASVALQALGARFGFKWLLYTGLLYVRAIFR